jgi:large-conductance mechanosensitive channel
MKEKEGEKNGKGYLDFMVKFNVIGVAMGIIIGSNLKDIAKAMIDGLIMPFIKPIIKKVTPAGGLKFTVIPPDDEGDGGVQLNLEKLVTSILQFACLSVIIFGLLKMGVNIKKSKKWVVVKNWDGMVGALKKT